jgi:hypothetical protein
MRSLVVPALVLALAAGSARPACAEEWAVLKDASVHTTRPQTIDAELIFGYLFGSYHHIGVAGWYGYPIVPDGFAPKLNDALYIEAGAALEHYGYDRGVCSWSWWRLTPMGGARYQMYLTDTWTAFATAKLGWYLGFGDSYDCGGLPQTAGIDFSAFAVDMGFGAYLKLSDTWSARFELSYFGLGLGAGTHIQP